MPERSHDEAAQLSALISNIYDAALDPDLWTPVLEHICAYVPGSMGNLFSQNALSKTASRYFSWGHDPYFYDLYLTKFAPLNPIFPASMMFAICEPFTSADVISFEELQKNSVLQGLAGTAGLYRFRWRQSGEIRDQRRSTRHCSP